MGKIPQFAAGVLALHGLIHLLGPAAYLRLANIEGLPYKTTIAGGRIDLGSTGIAVFGTLWILPAAGFLAASMALVSGAPWWRPALTGAATLSLVLCALDWNAAFAGAIVDAAILAYLLTSRAV